MAKKSNCFFKCHICVDNDETTYIKTFISYESCFLEQSGFLESAAESNRLKRRLLLGKSKDSYPTQCSCVNATFSMVNCALYTGRWISKARSQIEAPSKYTSKNLLGISNWIPDMLGLNYFIVTLLPSRAMVKKNSKQKNISIKFLYFQRNFLLLKKSLTLRLGTVLMPPLEPHVTINY